jgi:capsid protein
MAKDYSKTNYSSARASDLEDRREFRADQEFLEYHLVGPVWQRFLEAAVLEQKLTMTPEMLVADYDRYTDHAYQAPGWEWVDPVKEAQSSQLALQSNLTTLADELGQRGRDLMDTLRQRKREKELLESMGLDEQSEDAESSEDTSDAESQTSNAA